MHPGLWEIMNHIKTSAYKLDDIVHDLIKILDIKKSAQKALEPANLKEQIRLSVDSLEHEISNASAKVIIDVDEQLKVSCIRAYVQSIFYNLIQNSIKYARNDIPPVVKISASTEDMWITLVISDNGIGMDMNFVNDKLFKLYQRFNNKRPGKGLGLFLIKTQLESMNGSIDVISTLNQGTTFIVKCPFTS